MCWKLETYERNVMKLERAEGNILKVRPKKVDAATFEMLTDMLRMLNDVVRASSHVWKSRVLIPIRARFGVVIKGQTAVVRLSLCCLRGE
jgi:hypothetical protein